MHFKDRLKLRKPGKFIEVGTGKGLISQILLKAGWTGTAFDLNQTALCEAERTNFGFIKSKKLELRHGDWLADPSSPCTADLVISSLVLEHLNSEQERQYVEKCKANLSKGGTAALFVPGSPAHWGIDDEIAGHFRRYTRESLTNIFDSADWTCAHMVGLNYPISNILLPVSNALVNRAEKNKLALSMLERTKLSSTRKVSFKTTYPTPLKLLLNEPVMQPLHILQKLFSKHKDALILYAEYVRE